MSIKKNTLRINPSFLFKDFHAFYKKKLINYVIIIANLRAHWSDYQLI